MKASVWTGFLWGLCEGLFFLIVPDVLLCFWALKSWRHALISTLSVLLGTMSAACVIYILLRHDAYFYSAFPQLWSHIPGYRAKMLEVAAEHVSKFGGKGLLYGPSSGIAYRIYVLQAWRHDVSLGQVLLWTPFARLERILIAPLATLLLRRGMEWLWITKLKKMDKATLNVALLLSVISYWIAIYIWYWGVFVPATYGL